MSNNSNVFKIKTTYFDKGTISASPLLLEKMLQADTVIVEDFYSCREEVASKDMIFKSARHVYLPKTTNGKRKLSKYLVAKFRAK